MKGDRRFGEITLKKMSSSEKGGKKEWEMGKV